MIKRLLIVLILGLLLVAQHPKVVGLIYAVKPNVVSPRKPKPSPTPLPTPTATPVPTPTPTPSPTATPSPTPTPVPTPTPTPSPSPTPSPTISPVITSVTRLTCSPGSSCSSYLTTLDVQGTGFATNSRVSIKVAQGSTEIFGYYVGGNGSTRIITDFYNLPHCTLYDVKVSGSTGSTTAPGAVSSICP